MTDLSLLIKSLELPSGVKAEMSYLASDHREIGWADQKPSLQSLSTEEGVCLRVQEHQHQGLVTTRWCETAAMPALAETALEVARATPPDALARFGVYPKTKPTKIAIDTGLFSTKLEAVQQRLSDIEKSILKFDSRIKKVIKLQLSEDRQTRALGQRDGEILQDESSSISFMAEVLAEESSHTEVAWDYQGARFWEDLDPEKIGQAVAQHAAQSLGGKPIASGKYAMVVSPRVGVQLLGLAAQALSAEAVQRGRSFLRGQINQSIASDKVTLIDDPLLPRGMASAGFDDEGTLHQRFEMVSNGILKDYFYDLRSSSVEKRESNGHGIKGALGALPRPASTNFYMEAGKTPLQELLNWESRVFLLQDVMGLHMADPITGEFSLGASGILYENGRPSKPVRGVTIASTVSSMLKEVVAVASDFRWMGSTGAPSFLLSSIMLAGT